MPQYGFQLCGVGFARIAKIDFMMFSPEFNMITITVFLCKDSHPLDRAGLGGVRPDVHHLHAQSLLKRPQPYSGERSTLPAFPTDLLACFLEDLRCDHLRLQ